MRTFLLLLLFAIPAFAQDAPKQFRLDGQLWAILTLRSKTLAGETFCNAHIVLINEKDPPEDIRNTYWHELMHVVGDCKDFEARSDKTEESAVHSYIYFATDEYMKLWQENPQLVEFFFHPSKSPLHQQGGK
jgi:hypothetical protein